MQTDEITMELPIGFKNRAAWENYWRAPNEQVYLAHLLDLYMPLARRVLSRIMIRLPSHVHAEDLLNSAMVGLYGAITRFDPQTSIKFEAFAARRIRGAILDELRACDPLSRRQREQLGSIEKAIHSWATEHNEFPDHAQLADAVSMELPDLLQLMDYAQPWVSLDVPCSGEYGGMLISEMLAAEQTSPDQEADVSEMRALMRCAFRQLDTKEKKILYLYYYEELRLREIAVLFELTEARVCQIHSLAVTKLRQAILKMMNPVEMK